MCIVLEALKQSRVIRDQVLINLAKKVRQSHAKIVSSKVETIEKSKQIKAVITRLCRPQITLNKEVHMNSDMIFPTVWYVRPAKAQTSLRVSAV